MPLAVFHYGAQCLLHSLNVQLPQQINSLCQVQALDEVLLHIGGRILMGTLRPGAAGQENLASTLLAIDGVEPLANPRTIR